MLLNKSQERFIALFSQFTNISKERVEDFLAGGRTLNDIFRRPKDIAMDEKEMIAIEELKELRDIYNELKSYDRPDRIKNTNDAFKYFQSIIKDKEGGEVYSIVLFLDTKNRPLNFIIRDTPFDESDISLILKKAILESASAIMLCHNHPSSRIAIPSVKDRTFTTELWRAGWCLNVSVLDHILLVDEGFVSLLDYARGSKDFVPSGFPRPPWKICEGYEQISFNALDVLLENENLLERDVRKARFIDLFSKYTGISIDHVEESLESRNVIDLLQRPGTVAQNQKEYDTVENLREMRNVYEVIKTIKANRAQDPFQIALGFFQTLLNDVQDKEYLNVMYFDAGNRPLGISQSEGTIDANYVFPREIMKEALLKKASSIVVCHNHPSGIPDPSGADINMTLRLYAAGRVVGIDVLDHIVLGNECYKSIKAETGSPDFGFATSNFKYSLENGPTGGEGIREKISAAASSVQKDKGDIRTEKDIIR